MIPRHSSVTTSGPIQIHSSQDANITRCKALGGKQSIIFNDEPGFGKTRQVGVWMNHVEESFSKKTNQLLQIFVSQDLQNMQEQFCGIGLAELVKLIASQMTPNCNIVKGLKQLYNCRAMMSHKMLKNILFGDKALQNPDGTYKYDDEMRHYLNQFFSALSSQSYVVFFVDEVHTFINGMKNGQLESVRQIVYFVKKEYNITITFHGVSATAPESLNDSLGKFFGRHFHRIKMTEDEMDQFRNDNTRGPPPPEQYEIIELANPLKYKTLKPQIDQLCDEILLYALIINMSEEKHNNILFGKDDDTDVPEKKDKLKKKRMLLGRHIYHQRLYRIIAWLATETPTSGGKILELLKDRIPLQVYDEESGEFSASSQMLHPGVVVGCAKPKLALEIEERLRNIGADSEIPSDDKITFHDIRFLKSWNDLERKHEKMFDDVKSQARGKHTGPVAGLIDQSQFKATNKFAKNIHRILLIDGPRDLDPRTKFGREAKQLRGRISRPTDYKRDDLMPEEFKAYHLVSSWVETARALLKQDKQFDMSMENFLEKMDTHLNTSGRLVEKYKSYVADEEKTVKFVQDKLGEYSNIQPSDFMDDDDAEDESDGLLLA